MHSHTGAQSELHQAAGGKMEGAHEDMKVTRKGK